MSDDEFDLAAALGADRDVSTQKLTIFVPDRDRDGREVEIGGFVGEVEEVLADIGGGFSKYTLDGGWKNPQSGRLVRERTQLIYTFIDPERFVEHMPRLRSILHRFGDESNQGEVAVQFENELYRIRKFQP